MNAQDAFNLTENALVTHKDVRLDKYIEWIERDITNATTLGKFQLKIDYMDRPLTDEFILKIQDHFIGQQFNIITSDDPTQFRQFIISWYKDDDALIVPTSTAPTSTAQAQVPADNTAQTSS